MSSRTILSILLGITLLGAVAFILARFSAPPQSNEAQDMLVSEGAALASLYCARCHAIQGQGPSPHPDAPLFSTFHEKWPPEYLAESMAEGIMVGHEENAMPVFAFTPEEIDALIAYLKSFEE